MGKLEVEAVVTGSRPMPAYGGVQLADGVLDAIAEALQTNQVPMVLNHDIRRRLDAAVLDSGVRDAPDGSREVWVRFLVDADDWREFEEETRAAGMPGGFSFAASEPLAVLEGTGPASTSVIELDADASHWSDDILLAAGEELRSSATVHVGRRYEFAHDPAAVVVIQLAAALVTSVVGNALYDALTRFLRPRRPTIFQFAIERDAEVVTARLETDDPRALERAISSFDRLVGPDPIFIWSENLGRWEPLSKPPARRSGKRRSGDE